MNHAFRKGKLYSPSFCHHSQTIMQELKKKEMEALAVTLEELGIGADDVAKENESSAAAAKRKKKKEKKQTAAPDEPKNGEAAPSEPVLELQESTSAVANGSTEQVCTPTCAQFFPLTLA